MESLASTAQAEERRRARPVHEGAKRGLNILVLHQHYWPEIAATARILSDVCEDLATHGHQVTVVCGQPSYRNAQEELASTEEHAGVRIRRVWSYKPLERSIPKRLVHYGTYFASSLSEALRRSKPDVCLVLSTPPLLLGVSGVLLHALRRIPFVYSVQDLYPDIAIHLGVLRADGMVAPMVERVANSCYRAAASLVTLSQGMADRLEQKGVVRERIHVIPNWADTSAVLPAARDNGFAREHGLADGFVVQYSGNLGMSQGLGSLLGAAQSLASLPITFALVGDGNARASLEADAKARGLRNVRFLPPQPRDHLSELLSACDVGLVPMKREVGNDLVPSKLYGIMAAARPVLASVEQRSEVARVLHEYRCGWVVEPESSEALAAGIIRAFKLTPEERASWGENGRIACGEQFSRKALTLRYEQVLRAAAGLQ